MKYDAYKVHGFATRMLMGKESWNCVDLQKLVAPMPNDMAVDVKQAWLEGWDAADDLFVEGDWHTMSKFNWIKWYANKLTEEREHSRGDDNGLYLAQME